MTTIAVTYTSFPEKTHLQTSVQEKDASSLLPSISSSAPAVQETSRISITTVLNLLCFVLLLLSDGYPIQSTLLLRGCAFLLLRTAAVYCMVRFQNDDTSDSRLDPPTTSEKRDFLSQISMPMAGLLTVILVIKGPQLNISSIEVLAQAVAQAIWWYAFTNIIEVQMPTTAMNLDTLSLGASMVLSYSNLSGNATALFVLLNSVVQMMLLLHTNAKVRQAIYIFIVAFVIMLWMLSNVRLMNGGTAPSRGTRYPTYGHPIEHLITEKRLHFDRLLEKQSKTVDEAVVEYQRRYQRRPPVGFDKWFQLAQEYDFMLPDEFDTFMQSLEPFNGIHPAVLQQRMDNAWNQSDKNKEALVRITYGNGNVSIDDAHNIAKNVIKNIANMTFADIVPYNLTLLLNTWDEPMVSSPWDEVQKAMKDARDPTSERFAPAAELTYATPLIEASQENGWSVTRAGCPVDSPARQNFCPQHTLTEPLEFVSNASASSDVCQHCEIRDEYGMLIAPTTLHMLHELVPILSTSRPSHFNDMLCPSYWYIDQDKYEPQFDKKWAKKDNIFYWAGSTTGSQASVNTWQKMQRQRLVLDTNKHLNKKVQLLEQDGADRWSPSFASMAEVAHLFSTRITNIVQCDDETRRLQEEAFFENEDTGMVPKGDAYTHRFIMDIDGNGFSGRFYRLLKSNSVTIKATILREWHDDRLIPWVHYVPLSMNFRELPEMARFLATTERGLELSERIARESSEWHDKVLKPVDLQIAFLRMVLEFGRVMNPHLTL